MLRLFFSLYFVIVVALLTINWGSEQIWRYLINENQYAEFHETQNIIKSLPSLILSEHQAIAFSQHSGYPLKILKQNDLFLPPSQLAQLASGEAIMSYDENDQLFFYVQAYNKKEILQIGPVITHSSENMFGKYSVIIFSYLLLALIIAWWIRPIWQDISQLTFMAKQISQGDFKLEKNINHRSPTALVVNVFIEMAQRITQLVVEQQQLINAVSHELRTPLSRLKFSLALLPKQYAKPVSDIKKDITEMEQLVDELLGYARIENLQKEEQKNIVNIDQLLTNQVAKHSRHSEKEIYLQVVDDLSCLCHGHLLERAVQNLITNALRFAKQKIKVEAAVIQENLVICVSDDGCGVAKQNQEMIFNAFSKVDKSRNKNESGFGLGLAIVKRIVELHQGRCEVSSSDSGGAKFSLFIPCNIPLT